MKVRRGIVLAVAVRLLRGAAWSYPLALLAVIGFLSLSDESFWLTTLLLYIPRLGFALPLLPLTLALWLCGLRNLLLTQVAAALLVVFPLMGLELAWPRQAKDREPMLTLFSCNVHDGVVGVEKLVAEIAEQAPDLIVLQEADPPNIEQALRGRWPRYFFHQSTQFLLASRLPILSVYAPPKLLANRVLRSPRFMGYTVDTSLGVVDLYNVHPISPREALAFVRGELGQIRRGRLDRLPGAGPTAANAELRRLQIEAVSRHARSAGHPVLIAGDTNLPKLSRMLRRYFGNYSDGFTEVGWGFGYTFPTYRIPWMRIDRILAGPEFEYLDFRVGDGGSSDHACVSAKITARR